MTEDYCEHCDLPLSTCVHGNPPAPPPDPVRQASPRAAARPVSPRTAPARAAAPRSRAAAAPPASRPRRRTPPEDFKPWIVSVLSSLGGEASAEEVMEAVGEQMSESMRSGDGETGPTGELRWRTACRTARKHLADDGRLIAPQPGVWRLIG